MTEARLGLPDLGFGVGLRTAHYPHILKNKPDVDWFEIISENYMDSGGRPRYVLEQIVEQYKVVMHGVSLSIGSTDSLNFEYLAKLKTEQSKHYHKQPIAPRYSIGWKVRRRLQSAPR